MSQNDLLECYSKQMRKYIERFFEGNEMLYTKNTRCKDSGCDCDYDVWYFFWIELMLDKGVDHEYLSIIDDMCYNAREAHNTCKRLCSFPS